MTPINDLEELTSLLRQLRRAVDRGQGACLTPRDAARAYVALFEKDMRDDRS